MTGQQLSILAGPEKEADLRRPLKLMVMQEGTYRPRYMRVHTNKVQAFGSRPGNYRFAGLAEELASEDDAAAVIAPRVPICGWLSVTLGSGLVWLRHA